MREYLVRTSHKPRPLPAGRWAMTQRWNDLLFAHWPIPGKSIDALLPEWLEADTFQGSAWLGAVPFWLDRIKIRGRASHPRLAPISRSESAHLRPRPVHGDAGLLLFLGGVQQPDCGSGGAPRLSPALLPCGDASGATIGAGVCVLQPETVLAPAGDLQSPLPGTGAEPQDGGGARRNVRIFYGRAQLRVQHQPVRPADPRQPAPRSMAAGRGGGRD